jgi:hypothetical protein
MVWQVSNFRTALLALLALTAVTPAAALAEILTFRNDTKAALVIQGACLINGQVKRDRPIPLPPTGVAKIALPGNKLITIYDANQPNRALFQGTIPGGNVDLIFLILPDPPLPRVKLEQVKNPAMGVPVPR